MRLRVRVEVAIDSRNLSIDRRDLDIAPSDAKFLSPDLSIDNAEVVIDLRPIDFDRRDLDIASSDAKFPNPDLSLDPQDLVIEVREVVIDGLDPPRYFSGSFSNFGLLLRNSVPSPLRMASRPMALPNAFSSR